MLTYTSTADRYTVSGNSYTINFPYWKETEVKAVVTLSDGTLQDLVLNTDYSVSTPNGNNGTLTKLTAWTDADKLTIYRDSAKTQEVDLVQGQKINADTIENSLDHSVAIMQELQEKLSRTIASSIDEAGTDIVFPGKTARAGNLLGFDATGENIAFRSLAQFDNDVSSTATNAGLASASASAAAASESKAQKWAENPEDVEVETGKYSALHHAAKAKASATTSTNKALDSEAYAIGKRNGADVPNTDPAYHNNTKYYYDLVVGAISGALRYQGTWTTTGATDYSGIPTPRVKGDLFYCQGTACTIDGVTYTQGDLIIFNQDVASTITTSAIDKIDNTETVTPDNTCTMENKTIDGKDNVVKCSPTTISANETVTPDKDMNIVIDTASVTLTVGSGAYVGQELRVLATSPCSVAYTASGGSTTMSMSKLHKVTFTWMGSWWALADQHRPPVGVPTRWLGTKPSWAINFGDGEATQYLWANYPELDNDEFRAILDCYKTTGGSGLCADYDATGFYVPDLRGMMAKTVGTSGKSYGHDTIANVGAVLTERLPNIKGMNTSYRTGINPDSGTNWNGAIRIMNRVTNNTINLTSSSGSYVSENWEFDASHSNSIYTNSAHVSPLSFGTMWIVRYE